jgi:hypothetical protein
VIVTAGVGPVEMRDTRRRLMEAGNLDIKRNLADCDLPSLMCCNEVTAISANLQLGFQSRASKSADSASRWLDCEAIAGRPLDRQLHAS